LYDVKGFRPIVHQVHQVLLPNSVVPNKHSCFFRQIYMAFSKYLDICIYPMLNFVSLYYLIFDSLFMLFKFICILRFVPVAYG